MPAQKEPIAFGRQAAETKAVSDYLRENPGTTVTMIFPRPVVLLLDNQKRIQFREGTQEVPEDIADHWFLRANNVKRYEPEAAIPQIVTDHHVAFLASRGYAAKDGIEGTQRFVDRMTVRERAAFFADAAEWQQPEQGSAKADDDDDEEIEKEGKKSLQQMTKAELFVFLQDHGVEPSSKATKDDLLALAKKEAKAA